MSVLSLVASSLVLAGVSAARTHHHHADCESIGDVIRANAHVSEVVSLVDGAGLDLSAAGRGKRTLFLPTNAALHELPDDLVEGLVQDKELLTMVIGGHVATGGALAAADLADGMKLATVAGTELEISLDGHKIRVSEDGGLSAAVVGADMHACGWVVHMIDGVLLPGLSPTPAPARHAAVHADADADADDAHASTDDADAHMEVLEMPTADADAEADAGELMPEAVESTATPAEEPVLMEMAPADEAAMTGGMYGDDALAFGGEYGMYGAYGEELMFAGEDDGEMMRAAGSGAGRQGDDAGSLELEGEASTVSAGAIVAGAVVAGVAAVVAGVAGVVYAKKRAAAGSVAGSAALTGSTI